MIDGKLAGAEREEAGWRISKLKLTLIQVRQPDGSLIEICDTETTVGLFLQFKKSHEYIREACPTDAHPISGISYELAVDFCRWLSGRENLPPERGYRLPTVIEFVSASRAGAQTIRYYGDSQELLVSYARFKNGTGGVPLAAPVASLKPNDFGLFDTLGNISDLCRDPAAPQHFHAKALGGSVAHSSFNVACDIGEPDGPYSMSMPHHGFRIARSLSPAPAPDSSVTRVPTLLKPIGEVR